MPDTTPRKSARSVLTSKVLMPLVAAGASAAASYLAKKAPSYLEQVAPKLRDATRQTARRVPDTGKSAAGAAGDVAGELTDRAKAVVGRSGGRHALSEEQLERRQKARAEARARRRKASRS